MLRHIYAKTIIKTIKNSLSFPSIKQKTTLRSINENFYNIFRKLYKKIRYIFLMVFKNVEKHQFVIFISANKTRIIKYI
jgi:hypothetical protein